MDWRARCVTEEQVRLWALQMFIGAFPQTWSPISWSARATSRPIEVDYSDDDVVNDIIFALKDLETK